MKEDEGKGKKWEMKEWKMQEGKMQEGRKCKQERTWGFAFWTDCGVSFRRSPGR
jgi:hypothetical protein